MVVSVFQPGLALIDVVQQLLTETQVLQVFDQRYMFVMLEPFVAAAQFGEDGAPVMVAGDGFQVQLSPEVFDASGFSIESTTARAKRFKIELTDSASPRICDSSYLSNSSSLFEAPERAASTRSQMPPSTG